jgi:hypothetical protein
VAHHDACILLQCLVLRPALLLLCPQQLRLQHGGSQRGTAAVLLLLFRQAQLDLCCRQWGTIHGQLLLAAVLRLQLPRRQLKALLLLLLLLLQPASGHLLLVLILQRCNPRPGACCLCV